MHYFGNKNISFKRMATVQPSQKFILKRSVAKVHLSVTARSHGVNMTPPKILTY